MRCTKSKRKGGREAGSGWRMLIQEGQKEEGSKKLNREGRTIERNQVKIG